MNIVGFNGSPNRQGNTAFLLETALDAACQRGAKVDLVQVGSLIDQIDDPFCTACQSPCLEIQCGDENLRWMLGLLERAHGIILGSPVYFGTVSAQLKAFWDKTRSLRRKQALLNRPGGTISVAGARFGGQESALRAMQDMMMIHGMSIINDGSKSSQISGHLGVCAQKPAREDEYAIKTAKIMGERIVESASAKCRSN